jgi:hypothetical protein
MANYSEINNKGIQTRLDERYAKEINALQALGFKHLAYCLEDHGPYSALKHSLAALYAMRKKEVLLIHWPFRLSLANVLMAAENPPTIALCMGLGVKFYTSFYDGTVIISSDFSSRSVPQAGSKIIRLPSQGNLAGTWAEHQTKALALSGQMEFLSERMTFGDYVLMSAFEEEAVQFF